LLYNKALSLTGGRDADAARSFTQHIGGYDGSRAAGETAKAAADLAGRMLVAGTFHAAKQLAHGNRPVTQPRISMMIMSRADYSTKRSRAADHRKEQEKAVEGLAQMRLLAEHQAKFDGIYEQITRKNRPGN
jgi:hypothetical protein